jgi:hypothetical protein
MRLLPRARTVASVVVMVVASALVACARPVVEADPGPGGTPPTSTPGAGPGRVAASGAWREPPSYTFTLDSRCGERDLIGRFKITVEGGTVTKAEGLDEPAMRMLENRPLSALPTLGALLRLIDDARSAGAAAAGVEFDPTDGHPTEITIDRERNAIDDEECYLILAYAAG